MSAGTDHLNANESLAPNQSIVSASGTYQLILQGDSNLVLYKSYHNGTQRALWASNTVGRGAVTCVMQGDGNLVMYDGASHPIWASNTYGNPGSHLSMQDDGNLVIYRANNSASWASNTVQAPLPTGAPAHGDTMHGGEVLPVNQSVRSANGRYVLTFQGDGNLVLYKEYARYARKALWASNTSGRSVDVCIMQGDGNLVLYDPDGHPVWSSNTYGNNGARVAVQDDGNLVIYRANNSPVWASHTVQAALPGGPAAHGDTMSPGETLPVGGAIHSANGRYTFVFQADGNLVLYKTYPNHPQKPVWASHTSGRPIDVCIMQGDGNLVLYDLDAHPVWASNTHGNPGSRLVAQDDGNVVIYRPNATAAWATNTVQPALPTGPAAHGDTMNAGEILPVNQTLRSANGRYELTFQGDGNLVLYKIYPTHPRRALWATSTHGRTVDVCIMQADGNLVLYDPDAHPLWASNTYGNPGSRLVVQDDGNVVIYRANNTPAWATNTVQITLPSGPIAHGDTMRPGETLAPGDSVVSANGRYQFVFQGDGNLVLYKSFPSGAQRPLWDSRTNNRLVDVCIMQADGNLVLYDLDAHPVWASNSHGHPGSRLVVQDDGNVVIYSPGDNPVWNTVTQGMIIHWKTLVTLTNNVQTFISNQFDAMDELFTGGRVNLAMGTTEDLSGNTTLAPLANLDVGSCTRGGVTADQTSLYANRNNVGANDVVVYVVSTLIGGAGNFVGCASHPGGQPGAAVVVSNAQWLTAHEVGHVLDLSHVDSTIATNSDCLMWPNIGWTNTPPDLLNSEYQTMRDSNLTPIS